MLLILKSIWTQCPAVRQSYAVLPPHRDFLYSNQTNILSAIATDMIYAPQYFIAHFESPQRKEQNNYLCVTRQPCLLTRVKSYIFNFFDDARSTRGSVALQESWFPTNRNRKRIPQSAL